jgi:hypothetical protein
MTCILFLQGRYGTRLLYAQELTVQAQYDIQKAVRFSDRQVVITLLKISVMQHFLFRCQRLIILYIRNFTLISEDCFLEPPLRQRILNIHLPKHINEIVCSIASYF